VAQSCATLVDCGNKRGEYSSKPTKPNCTANPNTPTASDAARDSCPTTRLF